MHLVGFIIKKFVTMHGHMNVKKTHLVCLGYLIVLHVSAVQIFCVSMPYLMMADLDGRNS